MSLKDAVDFILAVDYSFDGDALFSTAGQKRAPVAFDGFGGDSATVESPAKKRRRDGEDLVQESTSGDASAGNNELKSWAEIFRVKARVIELEETLGKVLHRLENQGKVDGGPRDKGVKGGSNGIRSGSPEPRENAKEREVETSVRAGTGRGNCPATFKGLLLTCTVARTGTLGLSIVKRDDGGFYVRSVIEGGAAEAEGTIQVGDMLLAVNHEQVDATWTLDQLVQKIKHAVETNPQAVLLDIKSASHRDPAGDVIPSSASEEAKNAQPQVNTEDRNAELCNDAPLPRINEDAAENVDLIFDPFDATTWRPDTRELPRILTTYEFPKLTTFHALYQEYFFGRKEPPIRWVESHFGPQRRGMRKYPSWRSESFRGEAFMKVDSEFKQRKLLYDLFEAGMTPDHLASFVYEKEPEKAKDENARKNGWTVRWLIEYVNRGNHVNFPNRDDPAARVLVEDEAAQSQIPMPLEIVKRIQREVDELFDPFNTSTWRPKEYHLPVAVTEYQFAHFCSLADLYKEYHLGRPEIGMPPVQQLEKFFGPGNRGCMPSWRSQVFRQSRKFDAQFCRRKPIYDFFDKGKSVDNLLEIVRRNNPGLMAQDENLENGRVVRWISKFFVRNSEGFATRQEVSLRAGSTRKANNRQRKKEEENARRA